MTFKDLMYESLDSSFKIIKQETAKYDAELYYLNMEKEYRIFIEESDEILHIGFERKINNDWKVTPLTNDLSTKEILGLFGTIKVLLEGRRFKGIWIETDNGKKHQLYFNLISKLNKKYKFSLARNDTSVYLYNGEHIPNMKEKFKYKKMFK
jgi:hypothetical protein